MVFGARVNRETIIKWFFRIIAITLILWVILFTKKVMTQEVEGANVWEGCVYEKGTEVMFNLDEYVTDENQARKLLESVLNKNLDYVGDTITECGITFEFKDVTNQTYYVCSSGEVYAGVKRCEEAGFFRKFINMFRFLGGKER